MAAQKKKPAKKTQSKKVIREKVTAEGPVEIVVSGPEDMEVKNETTTTSEPQDSSKDSAQEEEKSEVIVKEDSTEQNSPEEEKETSKDEDSRDEQNSEEAEKNMTDDGDDGEGISFKKILLWTFSIILFFAAIGVLGAFVYQLGVKTGEETMQKKMQSMPTPTIDASPTPEETAKDAFTIEVLNGSGISGEAGRAQVILEEDGFTVSGIGNADSSNYEETTISAKKSVSSEWLNLLKKSLDSAYVVSDGDELSSDADTDVVITVGSSKPE